MNVYDQFIDELIEETKSEDISEQYQDIVQAIGVKPFLNLLKVIGGNTLYLPLPQTLCKQARNRAIINQFYSGTPADQLAIKYHLSTGQVYQILREGQNNE